MSLAKYPYVHGNPVNAVDPTGLFSSLLDNSIASKIQSILASQSSAQIFRVTATAGTRGSIAVQLLPLAVVGVLARGHAIAESLPSDSDKWGVPIIVWGGHDLPETTQHIIKALTRSGYTIDNPSGRLLGSKVISPLLSRGGDNRRTWLRGVEPCASNYDSNSGLWCDEYPYNSVVQGGKANYNAGRVSLKLVPKAEQDVTIRGSQGNRLKLFYARNRGNVIKGGITNLQRGATQKCRIDRNSVKATG
ncbi:NucA/NucB deoxyribonuclease domain-containing protein, partial [Crocosphaera sp. Alani8]|uniref:NucA/NucB deoxyribonuclease domain-containing protein n=1 Tax=Crocosphaera sp. Alani8 TaxID=3038952 RepID=UPI00313B8815